MIPSYLLSRTLVTTMMQSLLGKELDLYAPDSPADSAARSATSIWRMHARFERRFEAGREVYRRLLEWALHHRLLTVCMLVGFFLLSGCLLPFIGQDFFPERGCGADAPACARAAGHPSGGDWQTLQRKSKTPSGR